MTIFSCLAILIILEVVLNCDSNCASCRNSVQNNTYCLACSDGYSMIENGFCILENTIPNCATYDQSLNCIECKPTYEIMWNICQRTFDGCLLFTNNKCDQCLPGAILKPSASTCSVLYLNCVNISNEGICTACQPQYALQNGKCTYQNKNCRFIDKNTGLCAQCNPNSIQIGISCIPAQFFNSIKNCYLIDESKSNITCKYCKEGYGVYFGSCVLITTIINQTNNLSNNCSDPLYFSSYTSSCLNLNNFTSCTIFDYGFLTCLLCQPGYDLINNYCISISDSYCLVFNPNKKGCKTCKKSFYLSNGQCAPYPPFCVNYTTICTQCQFNFRLVFGNCIDPNCQTVNPLNRYCQICVANYKLNLYGVCKFMDPNCQQFNQSGDCSVCMKGYSVKSLLQYCVYQDLNCLAFDQATGNCNMCKPFFSYNDQVQLCIPLSDNCQTADLSGRCSNCLSGYTLISNYTCIFITPIPNCQMISKDDFKKCVLCINGSYADQNGVCKSLPVFCAVYDAVKNQCQQCKDNGLMKNGNCVDKNCQIFDLEGECLACITSFQFNSFGQCSYLQKDPNCKQFLYGICKSCVERYYFDFQFVCTAVSPFCKTYDPNSGVCLSCYDGYQLNINGGCFLNIYYSIVGNNDVLSTSCMSYNSMGQCIQCYFGYQAIPISNVSGVVNCVQGILSPTDSYCINLNSSSGKCSQCVSRMFVNRDGECEGVDENCNIYNQTNGVCISCYSGYKNQLDVNTNKSKCLITAQADPNCQIMTNISGCSKCYNGYYYSLESIKCVQVNQLCSTYNQTTGECLTCYIGYNLKHGNCQIDVSSSNQNPLISSDSTGSTSNSWKQIPGCLQVNSTSNSCINCDWGYALINGTCTQRDPNCQSFLNAKPLSCVACYSGYKPFGSDQSKCVLQTLIIDHCLKYSATIECILCENGYALTPSQTPTFLCNQIDQNCLSFNSTSNTCQKCSQGSILSGRFCILPTYGIDQNCIFYSNKLCTACKTGYTLSGYLCTKL